MWPCVWASAARPLRCERPLLVGNVRNDGPELPSADQLVRGRALDLWFAGRQASRPVVGCKNEGALANGFATPNDPLRCRAGERHCTPEERERPGHLLLRRGMGRA